MDSPGYETRRLTTCKAEGCANFKRVGRGTKYCSVECRRRTERAAATEKYREAMAADPAPAARERLFRRYGVLPEQRQEWIDRQGGICANPRCDTVLAVGPRGNESVIDHDHACCPGRDSCGRCIRGVLCQQCNLALGLAHDDPWKLRGLAEYVEWSSHPDVRQVPVP